MRYFGPGGDVKLPDGMHLAPPAHLSAVTAEAGRLMGLEIVIHLVDYLCCRFGALFAIFWVPGSL
jgi:hypothetical protein